MTVGEQLDDLDLEVARTLGAIGPGDLGSSAPDVSLTVTDEEGWVMQAVGWRAIFGHYTPALRPASTIEVQVACLRGLLATGRSAVAEVTLSLSPERCGTFRPRPTPRPRRQRGRAPRGGAAVTREARAAIARPVGVATCVHAPHLPRWGRRHGARRQPC